MNTTPAQPGPLGALMRALHRPVYQSRLRELVRRVLPHLRPGDRVLDVGCGSGALGRAILDHPTCPKGVTVTGIERFPRGGEPIEVIGYDGVTMPLENRSFDAVIVADVLHHEEDPDRLIRECARVSRRIIIVKDHQLKGPLARARVSFIDWAANAPYAVKCLYRYNTPRQWRDLPARHHLALLDEARSINLYPPGYNILFGRALQYMAVWGIPGAMPKA